MMDDPRAVDVIAAERSLLQVSDESAVVPFVDHVIEATPQNVALYRAGKTGLVGFFPYWQGWDVDVYAYQYVRAYQDLCWALVNSKEFLYRH